MKAPRVLVLLVPSVALVAAGCSSSNGGSSSTPPPSPSPSTSPSTSTSSAAAPVTPTGLGQAMDAALRQVSSAHMAITATVAGQSLTGSGDETMSNGKATGLKITEDMPGGAGSVQILIAGGKTYVKLPAALNPTGKPYLVVTPNSSNPVIKRIASTLDTAVSSASVYDVGEFARAAQSVHKDGTATVNGVSTTHYTVVVDVAKLPADLPARQQMTASGVTNVPVQLYVDSSYRPVEVTEQLTAQGQKVSTKVLFSRYNAPVTITAPPSSQVGG